MSVIVAMSVFVAAVSVVDVAVSVVVAAVKSSVVFIPAGGGGEGAVALCPLLVTCCHSLASLGTWIIVFLLLTVVGLLVVGLSVVELVARVLARTFFSHMPRGNTGTAVGPTAL